jgi:hypothetical protein
MCDGPTPSQGFDVEQDGTLGLAWAEYVSEAFRANHSAATLSQNSAPSWRACIEQDPKYWQMADEKFGRLG